jgi:hypothetical protein
MNSKRIFFVMVGVLVLEVAAIIGVAYLGNQQLQKQADKLQGYKTQSAVLEQEQTSLTKAKKDVTKYEPLENIAKSIVPQDKDQARAVREIVNIAAESGVKPTSITFPVSTLGGPVAASSSSGTTTPTNNSSKAALSQLTPVKGIKGVYNLQITIQQDATTPVPYPKFVDFLSRLEQNRRTAQVTNIVIQPSATNPNLVAFTLTLNEFIKP